jgi:hypothetical protein
MTGPRDIRERLPELLDERAPQRAPDELFERFAERMETARQRPCWATRERWFPMPTQAGSGELRRTILVMGALLLLTLAMAAAFAAGSRLVASQTTIIVAADGSGDVVTLGEAVARARDGDTVVVRPGTYTEVVTVTQDVAIRGEGAIESIVVRATDIGPSIETGILASRPVADQRYAVLIIEADPTLTGLTFAGESSAVVAIGGAPTITGNHFEGVGLRQDHEEVRPYEVVVGINAIAVGGGSRATIRGNRVVDSGPIASFDLSEPLIEDNELVGGAHIAGGFGNAAKIRNNHVEWASWGIESRGGTAPLIEGNTITEVTFPIYAEGGAATIRDNHIQRGASSDTGIQYDNGSGTIEGNTVNGYARGVVVTDFEGAISGNTIDSGFEGVNLTDSTGTVSDNQIKAVFSGITMSQSSPDVVDNAIEGSITGVSVVGEESAPTFSGNQLCGTTRSVSASDGATEPDLSGLGDCAEA